MLSTSIGILERLSSLKVGFLHMSEIMHRSIRQAISIPP